MRIGPFLINLRQVGTFIAVLVVLILVMNFNTRLGELTHLQNQAATVRVQATGILSTQESLQTQIALATSPAVVQSYARGEAHMGQPGDKVFVVLPDPATTPEPVATPTPVTDTLSPWDVWMIFIFGK